MESEVFVHSLGCFLISLVKIDNLPFLVSSIMLVPNNDCLTFNIFALEDIKYLSVVHVLELLSIIDVSEELPPS
jgi:hypothetical protein